MHHGGLEALEGSGAMIRVDPVAVVDPVDVWVGGIDGQACSEGDAASLSLLKRPRREGGRIPEEMGAFLVAPDLARCGSAAIFLEEEMRIDDIGYAQIGGRALAAIAIGDGVVDGPAGADYIPVGHLFYEQPGGRGLYGGGGGGLGRRAAGAGDEGGGGQDQALGGVGWSLK